MHIRNFALAALVAAVAVGCAAQKESASKPAAKAEAKPAAVAKAKPKLMMGASAEMLAGPCVACHGTTVSAGPASPTIVGMSEEYFVETMEAYKSGDRFSTIMQRIAKGYSGGEIKTMGKYFSSKKYKPALQGVKTSLANKGKAYHDKYCEKCHEDGGRSQEDDAGLLAGQWMPYLHATLDDYISGRNKVMDKKMRTKLKRMVDEQGAGSVEALVHYYGSQH